MSLHVYLIQQTFNSHIFDKLGHCRPLFKMVKFINLTKTYVVFKKLVC